MMKEMQLIKIHPKSAIFGLVCVFFMMPSSIFANINETLLVAAKLGNINWIRELSNRGANINYRGQGTIYHHRTALSEAIMHTTNPMVVKTLLELGANPNQTFGNGKTPLEAVFNRYATTTNLDARNNLSIMLSHLISAGADINNQHVKKMLSEYPYLKSVFNEVREFGLLHKSKIP